MGLWNSTKRYVGNLFGKGQERPQNCMLLTEYGEILDVCLDVKKGYINRELKETLYEQWGLDIGNQVKDRAYGHMQVISERDAAPIPLWEIRTRKAIRTDFKHFLHSIAEAAADFTLLVIDKKSQRERMWALITLIAVFLLISIVLIVGTPMFQHGVLHR